MRSPRDFVAIIFAPMLILASACQSEASYGGRDAHEWIVLLRSPSAAERAEAAYVLAERLPLDVSTIPLITALLSDSVATVRMEAVGGLISVGRSSPEFAAVVRETLPRMLIAQSAGTRTLALDVTGALGQSGRRLSPYVINLMSDPIPTVRAAAIAAIGNLFRPVDPARIELFVNLALRDTSKVVRAAAVEALAEVREGGMDVGATLFKALSDSSPIVREQAAFAIASSETQGVDVVAALAGALSDASPAVRSAVAQSLTILGRRASAAAPALQRAMGDSIAYVQARISAALSAVKAQ